VDKLRSIDLSLAAVCGILDEVAGEIRDAKLNPTDEHLRRIGRAMAEIFEVQRAIYVERPELEPEWHREPPQGGPDNRALTIAMVESIECEKRKDYAGAIALFEDFLKSAASQLHIDIAKNELARLRRMLET
jgi:hypothetical protein